MRSSPRQTGSWVLLGGWLLAAGCRGGGAPAPADAPADGPTMPGDPGAPDARASQGIADGPGAVGEPDAPAAPAGAPVPADAGPTIFDPALPRIHDHSGASADRVLALVRAALAGLGFDPARGEGPDPADRVFVGRHYLAWIDQTGFFGKMNGLWTLDGAEGDALDFVLVDGPARRPINLFFPGEAGNGRWPASYKGAEHLEFPSRIPEPNDPPGCAQRDWCNQYGLDEAPRLANARIPWWTACNAGAAAFSARHDPISVEESPGRLVLVYEGRLVKEADGDGTYDGDDCHADYLFADGVRRPVYLRVGYELLAGAPHFDRTVQVRNPEGNPSFVGDMSFIGGFVITGWPTPHPRKRVHRFWRPEVADVELRWGDPILLRAGAWNDLGMRAPLASDVLVGWIAQPLTLSASAGFTPGASLTVSHVGPGDNDDVGACLCAVHGAVEMGGGLIHAGRSLPLAGGQTSIEARRRLAVPSR
jgi:hypothetical protein